MIRVLICDDQIIVCEGLQLILDSSPDIQVVAVTQDATRALELIPTTAPDVVLMDLKMPGMNGIRATRQITDQYPHIRVLVLTTYDADEWVFDAVRSGAAGYLLKNIDPLDLIKAVKGTVSGQTFVDPGVAGKLFTHFNLTERTSLPVTAHIDPAAFSDREREVLRLLARGQTNSEIAQRLFLSVGTVRNYVSALFTKLDVSDRTQAALIAVRYGLIDIDDARPHE